MSEQLTYVLDSMEQLITNTRDDQLSMPTPCANWQVRDLINHFVGGGHMFAMACTRRRADARHGRTRARHARLRPRSGGSCCARDFDAAIAQPGAMERMVELPIGTVPVPAGLQVATFDVLVHCWDLATATGQSFDPPADVVAIADGFARQGLPPEARDGDTFKDEVTPPADASPLAEARGVHRPRRVGVAEGLQHAAPRSPDSERDAL